MAYILICCNFIMREQCTKLLVAQSIRADLPSALMPEPLTQNHSLLPIGSGNIVI